MSQYFPKPYEAFGEHINLKADLSKYATKTDLKKATGIDTSNLALKSKTEVDKIDVDKLKTLSVDLSKLSNVVNNDVVTKTVFGKLVAKVNNIDTSGFVLKTKYGTDKLDLEKKKLVMHTTKYLILVDLLKKTDYNAKITEIENKLPRTNGLATIAALTAIENKIPDVSNLVKKLIITH